MEENIDENKEKQDVSQEKHITRFSTGIYLKVSGKKYASEPEKENQKKRLADLTAFVEKNGEFQLVDVYIEEDNRKNISGNGIDAASSEYHRLMEDVRCGRVNCIVTDRISGIGRDLLEAGYYIGTIFPLLNVRFIAVADEFDSERQADREGLNLRLEALAAELTAKEFSRKQEAFREMCRETGRVMKTNKAYGYQFSEETGRLVIDAKTENYVRMIFAWALSGVKRPEIAKRLELLGAPAPGEGANQYKKAKWSGNMLQTILYNPVYAGFHVMGKRKVSLARGIRQHDVGRDEWLYFPDYHEAYITMEEYEEIRKTMNRNKAAFEKAQEDAKEKRKVLPDYFPEKVICADCNRKMVFIRGTHQQGNGAQAFGYYRCRSRKKDGNCRNRHVQGELLQIRVMDEIGKLTGEKEKRDFSPELAEKLVKRIRVHENGTRVEVDFVEAESCD